MKFLQIHTFYEYYLKEFYRRNRHLTHAGFNEQMAALIHDGYAAVHMLTPYLHGIGYETQFVVANCFRAQKQWAREHNVTMNDNDTGDWHFSIVREQIEYFKPDILYITAPIKFNSSFLRTLDWQPSLIVGWNASDIPYGTDWSCFDVMLSMLTGMRTIACEIGAKNVEHFFPGFPCWMNLMNRDVKQTCDVVFVGTWTRARHIRRNFYLTYVAESSRGENPFSCEYYLDSNKEAMHPEASTYNQGARYGIDMHKALLTGKIVIDARGSIGIHNPINSSYRDLAGEETANMRIFEATGTGAFLLAEYHKNLSDYFILGKEIETFHNEKELVHKIHYYLDHPEEREAIARRGQERCLRDYAMEKRAQVFDEIIKKYLRKNSNVTILS